MSMSKLPKEEVERIDEAVMAEGNDYSNNWYLLKYEEGELDIPSVGLVKYVDDYGGEGDGDQYWVVVKIDLLNGETRYFKKPGWYASHDGGYLDGDLYEVSPVSKQVVVYE